MSLRSHKRIWFPKKFSCQFTFVIIRAGKNTPFLSATMMTKQTEEIEREGRFIDGLSETRSGTGRGRVLIARYY